MPTDIAPAIVIGVSAVGAILLVAGIYILIRDGRRIATPIYITMGIGLLAIGIGMLFSNLGDPFPLLVILAVAVSIFLLGNLLGYPALVIFLLYAGLTILRRESRSLGNALALLAGIGLLLLPSILQRLAPSDTMRLDAAYMAKFALHLSVVLIVLYFGFIFAAFIAAFVLYRWRRYRTEPEAVIVLGSGLINGEVPPLLAARLDKSLEVQQKFSNSPVIITSGGQGSDEPRPEGEAMRDYLLSKGVDHARVVAETESRNTEENLRFSRKLLTDPSAQVVVATSSYHVFRAALLTRTLGMRAHVVGARTAWYYFPSALLREFVGIIRDRLWFTVLSVAVLIVFAISCTAVIVPAVVSAVG
ncbi:MAG TPA: YdcF family protein [Corynebacterium stationis]|nr:YdcF family protein [Corynebacterium stationis]